MLNSHIKLLCVYWWYICRCSCINYTANMVPWKRRGSNDQCVNLAQSSGGIPHFGVQFVFGCLHAPETPMVRKLQSSSSCLYLQMIAYVSLIVQKNLKISKSDLLKVLNLSVLFISPLLVNIASQSVKSNCLCCAGLNLLTVSSWTSVSHFLRDTFSPSAWNQTRPPEKFSMLPHKR